MQKSFESPEKRRRIGSGYKKGGALSLASPALVRSPSFDHSDIFSTFTVSPKAPVPPPRPPVLHSPLARSRTLLQKVSPSKTVPRKTEFLRQLSLISEELTKIKYKIHRVEALARDVESEI